MQNVSWQDNDTLYMSEKREAVKVGAVEASVPPIIRIPLLMFALARYVTLGPG